MEDDLKPGEGAGKTPEGDQETTLESLQAKLEALQADLKSTADAKERILAESSGYKARAQKAEGELSNKEKESLQAQGKTTELLALAQRERDEAVNKTKALENSLLKQKLHSEVAKHAKDAHDVDMILKVQDNRDLLSVGFDDENLPFASGVENYVNKIRETKPYLFHKASLPSTETGSPKAGSLPAEVDSEKAYIDGLRNCKTQRELDNYRAKHGRFN